MSDPRSDLDPQTAEFDTVAAWTAEVARDLGPEFYLPAGCRGSGSPALLRWFLERLEVRAGSQMLDCGAGVGGPSAFAASETGVAPALSDPEYGACLAARELFGLPVVQASSVLPFRSSAFDAVWCLGVLCTVSDQSHLLRELRRLLNPAGRLGLLVFVAASETLSEQPAGNNFPTAERLERLLAGARLRVLDSATSGDFAAGPSLWQERVDAVEAELERRHGDDPAWQTANRQAAMIGRLLERGELVGTALTLCCG